MRQRYDDSSVAEPLALRRRLVMRPVVVRLVARVEGRELKLIDYYEPSNWVWLQKRDLDMQVTPAIFKFKDRSAVFLRRPQKSR